MKLCRPVYSRDRKVGISINKIVPTAFVLGKTALRRLLTKKRTT